MIKHHPEIIQGSDEWRQIRCGVLTASNVKLIMTPGMKPADNDKERMHLYDLLGQRLTGYVEPSYIGDDMMRGWEDEGYAREEYEKRYAPVRECGFITNDDWGFKIGYSPDGLVGDKGAIEVKSRLQKYQVETILSGKLPTEYFLQIQTGMMVAGLDWIDFLSYCGGMPMFRLRCYPDPDAQQAIITTIINFEKRLMEKQAIYETLLIQNAENLTPTERRIIEEIEC